MLVSVLMITYNHSDYIEKAINSILLQKCNFDFELVICNDCSTDNTHNVISKIKNNPKYEKIIKYHMHKVNIGMQENFNFAMRQAKGDYIAICEGDDYWTDTNKLQKQVDFLEKNQNIILTCGNSIIVSENGDLISDTFLINESLILKTENIIGDTYYNFIPTASILFRNVINEDFLIDLNILKAYDWSLLFLLSLNGDFYFDKSILSAYRLTGSGLNSSMNEVDKIKVVIELYSLFGFYYPEFQSLCKSKIEECFSNIEYLHKRDYIEEIKFLKDKVLNLENKYIYLDQYISFKVFIKIFVMKLKKQLKLK